MSRWIIEGEWSGYVSRQRRVVHREVVTESKAKAAEAIGFIRYTDGTALVLSVRAAKPRERVEQIRSYSSLIDQCIRAGHGDVARMARS